MSSRKTQGNKLKTGKNKLTARPKTAEPVAKLSVPVQRAVTQIVKRQAETKYAFGSEAPTGFNSAITSTAEWYNCIPDVRMAGTDSYGCQPYHRVGVKIEPTILKLNWHIGFTSDLTRSCDDQVVLYVFKVKGINRFDNAVSGGDANAFLDQAQGGLVGFTGYLQQLMTPVNKEQFTLVHRKVIHLQKGVGLVNNDTTTGYAGNGNKTAQFVSLNMTNLPKLVYDDEATGVTPSQPNNYSLIWALGYAHTDGTPPDSIRQDIQVTFTKQLYFKDS